MINALCVARSARNQMSGPLSPSVISLSLGEQTLLHLRDDSTGHVAQVDRGTLSLLRQKLVHHGDAENTLDAIIQGLARLCLRRAPRLHAHDARDDLQIVLDAMVHLAHDAHLALQLALRPHRLRGIVNQDEYTALPDGFNAPTLPQNPPQGR